MVVRSIDRQSGLFLGQGVSCPAKLLPGIGFPFYFLDSPKQQPGHQDRQDLLLHSGSHLMF